MTLVNKLIIAGVAIVIICIASFLIYAQIQLSNRQDTIETEMVKKKDLKDNITRSMNEYATKDDIESYLKKNGLALKEIQKDMDKLSANIDSVNKVVVISGGQKGSNIPSTGTGPVNPDPKINCEEYDSFGYYGAQQKFSLYETFSNLRIPIGNVGFSAWQEKPWSIDIKPRQYHVTSVVGTDENQRHYFYNKFSVIVDGEKYDVKIAEANTKQEYPSPNFHFWNPKLFVGTDLGIGLLEMNGEFTPNVNIGILSYGRFKPQPDWSFGQLGIGYGVVSRKAQLVITPAVYNVGKHLPLMNNMYLGPSVHVALDSGISIMGGFRTAW